MGSNWIRFGNLSLQYKKDFGASSICKASDAERVNILVGSVLGGMESDLKNHGLLKPHLRFFPIHDVSYENRYWVDFGELGLEFDSLREFIAAV